MVIINKLYFLNYLNIIEMLKLWIFMYIIVYL